MKMMNLPYDIIFEAVQSTYGEVDCEIWLVEEEQLEGHLGCTFPSKEKDSPQVIHLSIELNHVQTIDIIIHEIAHVIAGVEEDKNPHGEEWEKVYNTIADKYNEIVCKKEAEYGLI